MPLLEYIILIKCCDRTGRISDTNRNHLFSMQKISLEIFRELV